MRKCLQLCWGVFFSLCWFHLSYRGKAALWDSAEGRSLCARVGRPGVCAVPGCWSPGAREDACLCLAAPRATGMVPPSPAWGRLPGTPGPLAKALGSPAGNQPRPRETRHRAPRWGHQMLRVAALEEKLFQYN